MNHLLRERAPISDRGWAEIDEEARERLKGALGARRLVDFVGPLGWEHSATNLGRIEPVADSPTGGVRGARRQVLPLLELRADFTLTLDELAMIDRGAGDADLDAIADAAGQIAKAENAAVLFGWPDAIAGIAPSSPHKHRALGVDPLLYPTQVAAAVDDLRQSGVDGPYGLALGPDTYQLVQATAEAGGVLLKDHLAKIIDGPIVWTPGIEGGVLLSQRGGDFIFECGQDLSVGYASHDADTVKLYLQESFSARVESPEAAVVLAP